MLLHITPTAPPNLEHWYENEWIIELFGGVVTSLIFIIFLRLMRPRIKIAEKIAKDGEQYLLKFINRGFFSATDIKLELYLTKLSNAPKGQNVEYIEIPMSYNKLEIVPSRFSKKGKQNALYACQVLIKEDLETLWVDQGSKIEFIVISRHGFSNNKRIRMEQYNHKKTVIVKGEFVYGNSTKIEPC